jgi:hypothetical protein
MGPVLALFLSVLGGALDGDILNWSMGGKPSLAQGGVTGVLGNGLSGSHNKYEGDASPTRLTSTKRATTMRLSHLNSKK